MAAPQIPNLNSLRRGRGRGRGIGRTDNPSESFPSGKDRIVQGTDNDASVSRQSAVNLGYLNDVYAEALTPPGSATRRFPIINRGTYVRTIAIDQLVTQFLESSQTQTQTQTKPKRKQIISLGAGSDTRVFRLFSSQSQSQHQHPSNLIYHEIDFAANTSTKIRAIRSTPRLQQALGIHNAPGTEVSISEAGDALHSSSYHIHPVDLRSLSSKSSGTDIEAILPGIERDVPTLLISECCLIYLSPGEAEQVVSFFTERLFAPVNESQGERKDDQPGQETTTPLGILLYEPIRPDDAFGRTMVSNLAGRGIQLQTLHKYASLEAQRCRLKEQGFVSDQAAADIEFIWKHWVSEGEKERVSGLEMLDEMEEWQLLARHYCIAWGWRDGGDASVFRGWSSLKSQDA